MMKLTRRYFLQGIGASAVLGTLTGLAPTKALAMNSYGANTSLLAKRAGTIKYSSCLRNCADRCLMKFSVQNGRMTYVRGADEQYKTGSCPCVKGLTYVEYTYAPDRILHPMVRVGEKGSHKWRRITWEEAWDILIKKTNEVIEQYGSEAILPYSYYRYAWRRPFLQPHRFFHSGSPGLYGSRCVGLRQRAGHYRRS